AGPRGAALARGHDPGRRGADAVLGGGPSGTDCGQPPPHRDGALTARKAQRGRAPPQASRWTLFQAPLSQPHAGARAPGGMRGRPAPRRPGRSRRVAPADRYHFVYGRNFPFSFTTTRSPLGLGSLSISILKSMALMMP